MKKLGNILLLLVLSFILFPIVTNASSKETEYISIYDSCDVSLDSFSLKNVHFDGSSDLRNLKVEIYKEDDDLYNFELIISYYDEKFNYLGDSGNYIVNASKSTVNLSQSFYNIDKNKVKYFKLNVSSSTNNSNSEANNQESQINTTDNYYIRDYDININVNENNTFDITEKITAHFNVAKHGIYRKIPKRNTITRLDGTTSNNRAKITDLKISDNYKTYSENGYKVIQIGNSNKTITGSHTYDISYKYNIGKDPLKNSDELYFNLIGTEWDTSISNVTFSITMPKEFDKTKLGFSSGSIGTSNSTNIDFSVDGNTIKGKILKPLSAGEAITVRLTLPEGYFVGANYNANIFSIVLIVVSLIFIIIAYVMWCKYGRDDKVIESVEFYPPEGYNSAEIAYLLKGKATSKDTVSLLIYLADKGYLKIEENGERITGLLSKVKDFKITKLKEYDGNNESERIFFNGLFKVNKKANIEKAKEILKESKQSGRKIDFLQALQLSIDESAVKNSVTGADLYNNFYTTITDVKKEIEKNLKSKIFESYNEQVKILSAMVIIIFILIVMPPTYEGNPGFNFIPAMLAILLFPIIGLALIIFGINKEHNVGNIVLGSIFIGMIIVSVLVQYALSLDLSYLFPGIVAVISIVILIIFIDIIPKRTKYGNEILGKIRGFKNFLKTAEKAQLELLVNQNPEYFYNILPYTYALGVSEIWMKQFESISMRAPRWYDNRNTFNTNDFNNFISSTMKSAQSTMTSSPSSGSGGTGGGSSGGGSGGGGGGSW